MGERTLLLGYDLGDEKTQMAVFDRKTMEPELVGQTEENPDALYDTEILLDNQAPIVGFVDKIRKGEDIIVNDKVSDPVKVLGYYFRKTLMATKLKYPTETIKQLVVTVADLTPEFMQIIYDALALNGILKERAVVIGHRQSYMYYILAQKRELWVNDVGMFDYGKNRLMYYQMQLDRRKKPIPVRVLQKDFSDALAMAGQQEAENESKGVVLENIVYRAIHKQILSALYMTGSGFEEEWADELFRKLCVGRRLFKGNNLYSFGACYAAREIGENLHEGEYLMLDEDRITSHVSVRVYSHAKEQDVILAKAGRPWYDIDESMEVIPDHENELSIRVTNIFSGRANNFLISLEPVAGKTNRHCRLSVRVRFSDVRTCIVTVNDRGFGEIFPNSNRVWEKILTIS